MSNELNKHVRIIKAPLTTTIDYQMYNFVKTKQKNVDVSSIAFNNAKTKENYYLWDLS